MEPKELVLLETINRKMDTIIALVAQMANGNGPTAENKLPYADSAYNGERNADYAKNIIPKKRMISTKEASEMFGLSECELRRGHKEGKFPAVEVGAGGRKRLRWNPDFLEKAILNEQTM